MIGMDRHTGKPLGGIEHLAQSIGDIVGTFIGTRGMRRDYGSMLPALTDQPLNSALRLLIYAATAGAVRRWEPRIAVKRVSLSADPAAPGQASITIEGDRTDLPGATESVILSIPIRAGGVSPVPAT
jgi:phage baseplate assembly protein W